MSTSHHSKLHGSRLSESQSFLRTVSELLVPSVPRPTPSIRTDLPLVASRHGLTKSSALRQPVTFTESAFVVRRLAACFRPAGSGTEASPKAASFTVESSPRGKPVGLPPIRTTQMTVPPPEPRTTTIATFSRRLAYHRRLHMLERNLIIVVFEGLLGAYQRTNAWSSKKAKLVFRDTAFKALSPLQASFQVVLFFLHSDTKAKPVLSAFESAGIKFDAVYRSNSKWEFSPYTQNFDQVLRDFHISPSQTLVVAPVELSEADLRGTKGSSVVLQREGRRLCEIHV